MVWNFPKINIFISEKVYLITIILIYFIEDSELIWN